MSEADRKELHWHLQDLLEKMLTQYTLPVAESTHVKNIERIVNSLTRRHAGMLQDKTFRIGPAQKALNLYLKYFWCSGHIPTPPHCPIDAIVLRAVKLSRPTAWTKINSSAEYTYIINALKEIAGSQSLAEWELAEWARREASQETTSK